MKLLMTQRALRQVGGSELVTAEVSKMLAERGHEVVVYSPKVGDLARLLWSSKVATVSELRDVPWTPDLIHGQHHLPTMAAVARFAGVPAIYYCHGRPWVEAPPLHPAIRRYVMMCEWLANSAATEFGLPADAVTVLPNFVNVARFSEVRSSAARPTRALFFGGQLLPPEEAARLGEACRALGIELEIMRDGRSEARAELKLPQFDIVFAIGRCAVEAMATGCAVIPIIPGQAGTLITPEDFDHWSFSNFSPRYHTSAAQVGTEWLRAQLERYDPSAIAEVTRRVRQERPLAAAVDALETIYRDALKSPAPATNDAAFAPYLEKLATEVDDMWQHTTQPGRERNKLRAEVRRLEKQLQNARRAPAKRFGRGLLERLRRQFAEPTAR